MIFLKKIITLSAGATRTRLRIGSTKSTANHCGPIKWKLGLGPWCSTVWPDRRASMSQRTTQMSRRRRDRHRSSGEREYPVRRIHPSSLGLLVLYKRPTRFSPKPSPVSALSVAAALVTARRSRSQNGEIPLSISLNVHGDSTCNSCRLHHFTNGIMVDFMLVEFVWVCWPVLGFCSTKLPIRSSSRVVSCI